MNDIYVVPTLGVARDLGARQRHGVLCMPNGDRVISVRQHPRILEGLRVGELALHYGVSEDERMVHSLRRVAARQDAR